MAVQLITYDLMAPGKDYSKLHDAIKSYSNWWHCLASTWMVETSLASGEVRDHLAAFIDANDKLLVVSLGGDWATRGLSKDCSDWLRRYFG